MFFEPIILFKTRSLPWTKHTFFTYAASPAGVGEVDRLTGRNGSSPLRLRVKALEMKFFFVNPVGWENIKSYFGCQEKWLCFKGEVIIEVFFAGLFAIPDWVRHL